MTPRPPTLGWIATRLRRHSGPAPRAVSRDPFHLVLWEQVAYLVPDARRRQAFTALRDQTGLDPETIRATPAATLRRIARLGGAIAAAERATRLRRSAELVVKRWGGDLAAALRRLSLPQARTALARFAMIGEPGADKILVMTGRARLLPLDSNGLRVLGRLGLVPEAHDYRTTYRRAQEALAGQLPRGSKALVEDWFLLRRHGQELCRRSAPRCAQCPLLARCPFGLSLRRVSAEAQRPSTIR
jgi:endonuclease III